jgi:hypothetical protein
MTGSDWAWDSLDARDIGTRIALSKRAEDIPLYFNSLAMDKARPIRALAFSTDMGSFLSLPSLLYAYATVVGVIALRYFLRKRSVSYLKGPPSPSWLVGQCSLEWRKFLTEAICYRSYL